MVWTPGHCQLKTPKRSEEPDLMSRVPINFPLLVPNIPKCVKLHQSHPLSNFEFVKVVGRTES